MNTFAKTDHKPSICFVALRAYNVLSERKDLNHTGGAEVQQLQIAKWLVRRNYTVSIVTLDHGQPDGMIIHGIKVFKAYAEKDGLMGLRFVYPRWYKLWAAMGRANADVYYQRSAECETGQVALWCRLHRRRFIFAVANDSDCDSSLYALTTWRDKILYRLGLRFAGIVTAQTSTQQELLRLNMGVESVLIRNCCQNSNSETLQGKAFEVPEGPIRVLWVGRLAKQKRLEWLLDVAERCSDIIFEVICGANRNSEYVEFISDRAARITNVRMRGFVPHAEMEGYYRRCHILCCTSSYEGFPNIFLEAWSLGIPVISTFDPDGIIKTNGSGWVVQNVEEIISCLKGVIRSPSILVGASKAARECYLKNYTPDVCLPVFDRLLRQEGGYENNDISS